MDPKATYLYFDGATFDGIVKSFIEHSCPCSLSRYMKLNRGDMELPPGWCVLRSTAPLPPWKM